VLSQGDADNAAHPSSLPVPIALPGTPPAAVFAATTSGNGSRAFQQAASACRRRRIAAIRNAIFMIAG